MTADHALLLDLQRHDTEADQARYRRDHHPARKELVDAEAAAAALAARAATVTAQRDLLAARQQTLEADVTATEARRAQVDRRLATGTNPKELQALSDEASMLARHQSAIEDQILEVMEQLEPLEAELQAISAEAATVEAKAAAALATLAEVDAAAAAELAGLGSARAAVAARLPADLRARYEALRTRLGGVAVAELRHGRCTGCNLSLSAVELDRLAHEPADVLAECEQCGRLLVRIDRGERS
jgi:predicted  nucleic acid-binding Zn-ribbon protein